MADKSIQVSNITKVFKGGIKACDKVSFHADSGSATALLGRSGCGKSTLMKIIAGFEKEDNGEIILGDRLIVGNNISLSPSERRIGIIFQDTLLFPNMTVEQNISYSKPRKGLAEELMKKLAISDLAVRKPWEISGGQARRVAIARSLAAEPDLIIMDEPFTGLDPTLRAEIRPLIFDVLREQGITVILVTHDPEDAFAVSDNIALMENGELRAYGSTDSIYNNAPDIGSASLLGKAFTLSDENKADLGLADKPYYRPEDLDGINLPDEIINNIKSKTLESGRYLLSAEYKGDLLMWWESKE
jgi:iron(III) transport system ATP-binding protein